MIGSIFGVCICINIICMITLTIVVLTNIVRNAKEYSKVCKDYEDIIKKREHMIKVLLEDLRDESKYVDELKERLNEMEEA